MTPEQIYETAQKSVVTIKTYDFNGDELASGSGVVISEDGKIISNAHVFEECEDFIIQHGDIIIRNAEVLGFDKTLDLILLKIAKGILAPLKIYSSDNLKIGKTVYSIGNPLGEYENTIASGIISGIRKNILKGISAIQFTSAISPGNSGGALVDENCELIGIPTCKRLGGDDISFAIPSSEINKIFKQKIIYIKDSAKNLLYGQNAFNTGNYIKAISYFDKYSESVPESHEGYFGKALALLNLENYDLSLINFNKAISLSPNDEALYLERAELRKIIGNKKEALEDYSKAIKFNPNIADSYNKRGWFYSACEKFEKAIPDFDKAIELDPNNSRPFYDRGHANFSIRNYKQAEIDYRNAIELDSNNYMYWFELGKTYEVQEKLTIAIECYNKALGLEFLDNEANRENIMLIRGLIWFRLYHYSNAIFDFTMLIEINSENIDALYYRGLAFIEMNMKGQAFEDFNKILAIDKNYFDAFFSIAQIYLKSEELDKSLENINKAISINSEVYKFYVLRGEIYEKQNKNNDALNDFEKSISLNPENYNELIERIKKLKLKLIN